MTNAAAQSTPTVPSSSGGSSSPCASDDQWHQPEQAAAALTGSAAPPPLQPVPSVGLPTATHHAAATWPSRMAAVASVTMVAAKLILLVLAWCCLLIFLAWQVSSVTWYREDKQAYWSTLRGLLTYSYKAASSYTLLSGADNVYLVFSFLAPLAAGVLASIAYALLPEHNPAWSSVSDAIATALRPVKRILNVQMPLRRLWLYWCGGLTVGEAVIWAGWAAVHAVGFYKYYARRALGDTKYKAWEAQGLVPELPESVINLEYASLACAFTGYIDFTMLFFPISHNTFLNRMLGIPYTGLIRFHRWIGHFAIMMVLLHGVLYYLHWIADPSMNFWRAFFDWGHYSSISYFAGTLSLVGGLLIWATSFEWLRRTYFNLFYRSHILGFLMFTVFGIVHYYSMWYAFFPGLFLWAADLVVRSFYSHKGAYVSAVRTTGNDGSTVVADVAGGGEGKSATKVVGGGVHGGCGSGNAGVTFLDVAMPPGTFKDPQHLLGAHLFVRVPAISYLEYHPFTIADVKVDARGFVTLSMAIKSFNAWSARLYQTARDAEATGRPALRVNVWRPFDQMHLEWHRYSDILLLAGGIAITPAVALLRRMIADVEGGAVRAVPRRVRLVFVSRHLPEFGALGEDILKACRVHDWLEVSLHHTGHVCRAAPAACKYTTDGPNKDVAVGTKRLQSIGSSGSGSLGCALLSTSPSLHSEGSSGLLMPAAQQTAAARAAAAGGGGDGKAAAAEAAVESNKARQGWRARLADCFWSCVRLFVPLDFLSDAQAIWAVLLAFLGGFLGFVQAKAFVIEYLSIGGGSRSLAGFVLFVIISVDCVGLPALLVLGPMHLKRLVEWIRSRRHQNGHNGNSVPSADVTTVSPAFVSTCYGSGVTVIANPKDADCFPLLLTCSEEAGLSLPISCVRPCVQREVAECAADADDSAGGRGRMAVVVAGPRQLLDVAALAVNAVNDARCCRGGCGAGAAAAAIDKHELAFEF